MAKAIAKALVHNKSNQIRVSAPSLSVGTNRAGIQTYSDNLAIIANAEVIILAVKPVLIHQVLEQIRPTLPANCLIISVASGIRLARFGLNLAVVRAMPNIAAALNQSATPLIANEWVTDTQKKVAEHIFKSMGITTWIKDESQIDTFTALSGSGPAYVFLFMEAMVNAAVTLGLSEEVARSFTLQTVQGALSLAMTQKTSLGALRASVTSPAGTTAAALSVFMERGLEALVYDAMQAACMRAKELDG